MSGGVALLRAYNIIFYQLKIFLPDKTGWFKLKKLKVQSPKTLKFLTNQLYS